MKCSFLAIAGWLLFAGACKKDDNNFNARISFLNGAVGAGTFTVKFNEDIAIAAIPFDSLKKYSTVPSGTFNIGFYQGTATSANYSFITNIESGRDYTCFPFDSVGKNRLFFQKDALPESVTEGKCAIRFFSLIPNTTNLFLQNDTGKLFITGKSFANYPNSFEEADTTSLRIKMNMTGIIPALDSLYKPLVSGKIYTIFLTGSLAGTGVQKPELVFWEHN
ncbi:MAG: DUF4397 domain-containing protein [Bacteroidota bacterium]